MSSQPEGLEARLRDSEERLRLALRASGTGVWDWDVATNALTSSPEALDILGRAEQPDSIEGFYALIHPADRTAVIARAEQALATREDFSAEFRIIRPDGTIRWVVDNARCHYDAEGRPQRLIGTIRDITAQRDAEAILRQWADAFEHTSHGIALGNAETGRIIACNPAYARLAGRSKDTLTALPIPEVYAPEDRARLTETIAIADRLGIARAELHLHRPDGARVPIELGLVSVRREAGDLAYRVATVVDISERKQAEESLRATRDTLAAIDRASPVPIVALDREGIVIHWNRTAERLFGWSAAEVLGRPVPTLSRTDALGQQALLERLRAGHPYHEETERIARNGQRIPVRLSTAPLHDADGRLIGMVAAYEDLTESRRLLAALQHSEEQLSVAFQASPIANALFRAEDRRIIEVNDAFLALVGRERRSVIGAVASELGLIALPEQRERFWHDLDTAGQTAGMPLALRRSDDTLRETLTTAVTVAIRGQRHFLVLHEDVTEHHRAAAALRESDARFRELAESISEVFWLSSSDQQRMLYISPGYESIWGRSCQSVYEDPGSWLAAVHPEDRARLLANARLRASGAGYEEEYRIMRPDGAVRWIRAKAFTVHHPGGSETRLAGVAEDITERRQLEMQLRQTQKLESVGLLAGGVAHDFNNWLTVISGCTELLMQDITGDPEAAELLVEVRHATDRAASLTRQLLAFSRQEVIEPRVMDLTSVVIETEKMLRRLLGEDIVLSTSLGNASSRVKIDPGQWGQVLMNLAVNARDAMPRGGRLTIETSDAELDEAYVRTHPAVKPGRYVLLAMTDTGSGMAPDVRQRIFEPFFTTKELGRGTGLGLAVVHGIVSQSGGSIEVYSEVGIGTTFRIYLPAVDSAATATVPDATMEGLGGTETILVVEDDDSLRKIAVRTLTRMGYTILQAENGEDALAASERHAGIIHLLLTDVVMPRMDGRELAERLVPTRPAMKVLYSSGYTDDAVVRHGVLQAQVQFLSKPYTPALLRRKVREVLDREQDRAGLPGSRGA